MRTQEVSADECKPLAAPAPRAVSVSMPGIGLLWFGGWLFTAGFAHLGFGKAALALVIWPYFLGAIAG